MDYLVVEIWLWLLVAALLGGGLYWLVSHVLRVDRSDTIVAWSAEDTDHGTLILREDESRRGDAAGGADRPVTPQRLSESQSEKMTVPSSLAGASTDSELMRRITQLEDELATTRARLEEERARSADFRSRSTGASDVGSLRKQLSAVTHRLERTTELTRAQRDQIASSFPTVERYALPKHNEDPPSPPSPSETRARPDSAGDPSDDLQTIHGIGPVMEKRLNEHGIYRYQQIAAWGPNEIEDFSRRLDTFPAKIRRDRWIERARKEHLTKYGEGP